VRVSFSVIESHYYRALYRIIPPCWSVAVHYKRVQSQSSPVCELAARHPVTSCAEPLIDWYISSMSVSDNGKADQRMTPWSVSERSHLPSWLSGPTYIVLWCQPLLDVLKYMYLYDVSYMENWYQILLGTVRLSERIRNIHWLVCIRIESLLRSYVPTKTYRFSIKREFSRHAFHFPYQQ
jgi:hypothetical protein